MTGFDRLTGALQHQIANTLGWRSLRPVQDRAIEAILDGCNCVVLAPTAGGKTEAAFFPLLSAMDHGDWRPVSVLYLSPIRALLNNQETRVEQYAGLVGRRAFKWHGDVRSGERGRFMKEPADVLLSTPESLEAMLMSPRVSARALFEGLQAVVIDEVHAFADDDRGAHLTAVLERLQRLSGRDVQRIGLSATVGNPGEILRWLQGSSKRAGRVVDPGGARRTPELALDYVGSLENAARVVAALHPGRKRLVFVDSRSRAEQLGLLLRTEGVDTFLAHGSLSLPERRDAERAFTEGQNCVVVATSALELGIDVGDLDHVLQLDSPPTVASFLQRMGRTGRRANTVPNCTFLATQDRALLQAAAIIQLFREGYVEPVRPDRRAFHILAHQVMALSIQLSGVPLPDVWTWLRGAAAFADLGDGELRALVAHMLSSGILSDQEGKLWLGEEGEKRYGRANFRELYAVFEAPRLIQVRADTAEIGSVDAAFLSTIDSDDQRGSFTLAGRAWQIQHVDWDKGVCAVRPAPAGRAPRWMGSARFLGRELCQAMRRVLVSEEHDPAWSARARAALTTARAEHDFLRDAESPIVEHSGELTWWTFAGGAANLLLARMLERELGAKVSSRNTSVVFQEDAAKSVARLRQVLDDWRAAGRPTEVDALPFATLTGRRRLSKFEQCLPEQQVTELTVRRGLDAASAQAALAIPTTYVQVAVSEGPTTFGNMQHE